MENCLKIAFASDDNYAQHMGVSILSLFEANSSFDEITVYVLDNGIGKLNKENLNLISRKFVNRNIVYIEINSKLDYFKSKYKIPSTISISSYSRLFLTELLDNDVKRIIYADSDSLFLNNLTSLWQIDLENYMIAGVKDIVDVKFKKKIELDNTDHYVNAGFLFINLKKWREENVFNEFIKVILKHGGSVPHHDQGVLNAVFKNAVLILPPKYNVVTTFFEFSEVQVLKNFFKLNDYYCQTEFDEAKKHPVFLHFTPSYSKRPWFINSRHPLKKYYFEFLKKTNWKAYKLKKDNRKLKVLILEFIFWKFGATVAKNILKFKK